ncbi:MAG: hypothetical protein HY315_02535 [Acidobacteria bacterium]|nr:hypothetical protein [Acidobacteriota bacterium]
MMAAVLIASVWYTGKMQYLLLDYLPRHAAEGAAEGDPALVSPLSWIYYFQFLLGYQLFFPLAAALAAGAYWSFQRAEGAPSLAVVWVLYGPR